MTDRPDDREIAVNLISALEMQREAAAATHVERSQPLTQGQESGVRH